ncbi:MAG: ankyrin repeat domain-containing protein [Bacteroidia bacterium]
MQEIVEIIKTGNSNLLEEKLKANPSIACSKTDQDISLLQFAAYCRNKEAIEILVTYLDNLSIYEAASIGDKNALIQFIKKNPEQINSHAKDGFTPLGLASFFGHIELVKLLLENNADPNIAAKNQFMVTPLHSACATSNQEIAKILIENNADVNAKQMQGVTPLHSAVHNGHVKLVKLLIESGADLNAKMDNGQTPLSMAHEVKNKEIIKLIELSM